MLLPINWLKDYIKVSLSPEKLAELLMLKSFEVEDILSGDVNLPKVVVVEILKIRKHPNADKLQLVEVSDGKREYEVVCGAPNIEEGQKVAFAKIGAELPNGLKIEKRKVRGEVSEGMICAEDELGVGEDHEGILVLSKDAKLGDKVDKYLSRGGGLVLDLSITPDRNDCFSVLGLAREISALTGATVKYPKKEVKEVSKSANRAVKVDIQNKNLCPQYFARVIKNVKVGESPAWLKEKLESMGTRSINNVVDVTNFVLFEMGQPLHAFDADKIDGNKIIIRNAKKGEKISALDEKNYELDTDMLVIADSKKPVAIAGIMGGEETSVDRKTKNIILESAIFNPKTVRMTSKKLGLRSESSTRFERGFDTALTEQAINRAAALIQELCGGDVLKGVVAPLKIKPEKKNIKLSLEYLNKLIGVEVEPKKVKSILSSLGFIVDGNDSVLSVDIPSWRQSVNHPADLVEEVVRIYGYNELPDKLLCGELGLSERNIKTEWENKTKDLMQNMGFDEVYNYSFYGEKQMKPMNLDASKHLEIENPINPDQQYLRMTLLPRLLGVASKNARKFDEVKIFEVGKVYNPEELRLAGVIVSKQGDINLYREIRGVVAHLLNKMNLSKKESGWILKMNLLGENEKAQWKLKDNVACFELNLEKIIPHISEEKLFKALPLYPSVFRDLSVTIPENVAWEEIEGIVKKEGGEFLEDIEFFDMYKGGGMESGKKSVAFHLSFSSSERTLKAEEVDEVMGGVVRMLEKKLKANLRV
ncbi:MAG: phenylalanine--tRNA ligase subunit beta [Parcubacteria group bacterium]|nr:phenylalanine--tRNA ligase subunit beta [Parcubacteria group bacterium]